MATEPTEMLYLKAPVDFWDRLDRWREDYAQREDMTVTPSRPKSIRWIVHQFLLRQEQARKRKRATRRKAAGASSGPGAPR
jgi:hypothetical protein